MSNLKQVSYKAILSTRTKALWLLDGIGLSGGRGTRNFDYRLTHQLNPLRLKSVNRSS
jgi:hypothetical protein